jgi:hypothetical protein
VAFEVNHIQAVDTVVPTVTIADNVPNSANGAVTFTYTFSEAVTGFDANDITVTGGTKSTFTAVSPTVYTLVVNTNPNSTTPINLTTSTTGVVDAAGNQVVTPNVYTQTVDSSVPTVQISDSVSGTANGVVTFTYTFSEAVTGFDTNDITVTGGTKSTFTAVSSTEYTLVVTPTANSTTPITLATSTTGVSDTDGNTAVAPVDYTQTVDTVAPTVSSVVISAAGASGTRVDPGDVVTVTTTYSEAVSGSPTTAPTLTIGTETGIAMTPGVSTGNTITWTYAIGVNGIADTGSISVVGDMAAGVRDLAGNTLTGTTPTAMGTFVADSSVISMGTWGGQLIAPVQVEGKWYYVWDVNGNGTHGTGDSKTLDQIEQMFYGNSTGTVINESNRTMTLANGMQIMLPTVGVSPVTGTPNPVYLSGTAVSSGTVANTTYDDYLAIWDAYNGAGTGTGVSGLPSTWTDWFWSASPLGTGHAVVSLGLGRVHEGVDSASTMVVFQVL